MYALANGCPLGKVNKGFVVANPAGAGHLALFQALLSGFDEWNESLSVHAAQGGLAHLIDWVKKRGFPFDTVSWFRAASSGQKNTLSGFSLTGFRSMKRYVSERLKEAI